ncbi:hypothetical protein [Pseudomonas oryzihabitans]|uniref:hypothetical protein n=1 Tax=Pseudomonas oryzihabitans TaxID=47885 RepID=UPI00289E5A7A|nr:hypothetical protein [Pseudomonas oryzihabitans]
MNDEQFEGRMQIVEVEVSQMMADQLRARDTSQREALARLKADHEANGLEYGEALILIGQVLDCRSLEDLNAVRRYLNEFMDRYSLRPVPDVDLVQAEQQEARPATFYDAIKNPPRIAPTLQQEAQRAQAGEFQREYRYIVIKRKDLVALHRDAFGPTQVAIEAFYAGLRLIELQLPRRDYLVIEGDWPEYEPTWLAIQARFEGRAALATQPAAGDPEQKTAINTDDLPTKKYPLDAFDFDSPAAAHGDEAMDELRRSVAEILGQDPDTWPSHGNAPLAIASALALATMRAQAGEGESA